MPRKNEIEEVIRNLERLGISYRDACALRRISMTLRRWFELECGDGNNHGSWTITRGHKIKHSPAEPFVHDEDGKPHLEHHHYLHGRGKDYVTYTLIPDRENGAKKRLAKIMQAYPQLGYYIQTDPRGCALYVLKAEHMPEADTTYNMRGTPVY